MIIDDIPLRLFINSKKCLSLNFNRYIKNSYYVNLKLQRVFKKEFKSLLGRVDGICPEPPVFLVYTLFLGGYKDDPDLTNALVIIDKFTQDCLVNFRIIPGDNTNIVKKAMFEYGGIDRRNPRAMLEILPYKKGVCNCGR